jgi:hypothetical protein
MRQHLLEHLLPQVQSPPDGFRILEHGLAARSYALTGDRGALRGTVL